MSRFLGSCLSLPSASDIFSPARFLIPELQSLPSFLLISGLVFLVMRFPQAYNQLQQDGLHKFSTLQFPN